MAKFAVKDSAARSPKITHDAPEIQPTLTHEGGVAFSQTLKQRLASQVLSSFREDTFYETAEEHEVSFVQDIEDCANVDPLFLYKLAYYARNEMNMRSSSIFIMTHAAMQPSARQFAPAWMPYIISRADELAEVVGIINSFFQTKNLKPKFPRQIRYGLSGAIKRFDAYSLQKYRGLGRPVNLHDVFNVVHPKPDNAEQAQLWADFRNNKLPAADTWERALGGVSADKGEQKEAWEKIIPKMKYMALLRNLKKFVEAGISMELAQHVVEKLTNAREVKYSKQLPFRFLTAYKVLRNEYRYHTFGTDADKLAKLFLHAVTGAMYTSLKNLPKLGGTTAILSDHSGSMTNSISENSIVTLQDVAMLLSAVCTECSDSSMTAIFAEDARLVRRSPYQSIMEFVDELDNIYVGHATRPQLVFPLLKELPPVDRIFLLSDMQCWPAVPDIDGFLKFKRNEKVYKHAKYMSKKDVVQFVDSWLDYKKYSPKCWLHSVDMSEYGKMLVPTNWEGVALHYGWTDKFIYFANQVESGYGDMISEIEAIELPKRK